MTHLQRAYHLGRVDGFVAGIAEAKKSARIQARDALRAIRSGEKRSGDTERLEYVMEHWRDGIDLFDREAIDAAMAAESKRRKR